MKLEYMKEFLILVECGSYIQAAKKLNISQAMLMKHISRLEQDLGDGLFMETYGSSLLLSEHGQLFLEAAQDIVNLEDQFQTRLEKHINSNRKILISTFAMMSQYRITKLIYDFMQEYPDISVQIHSRERRQPGYEELIDGRCELAFIRGMKEKDDEFEKLVYKKDYICAVLPQNHPLALLPAISVKQLEGETFILLPPSTVIYHTCIDLCRKAGFEPSVLNCFEQSVTVLETVAMGLGVSMLLEIPACHLRGSSNIVIKRLEPPQRLDVCLAHLKKARLSKEARLFWDYVKARSMKET